MQARCKPGDLALVIAPGPHAGKLVEVLFAAPDCEFYLPNGVKQNRPTEQPSWVINVLGSPVPAHYANGSVKMVTQGVAPDRKLCPLPGESVREEEEAHAQAS